MVDNKFPSVDVDDYKKWLEKIKTQENPDLCVLETFFDTVQQHLNDPGCNAAEDALLTAMVCVCNYLKDRA
jgi:hypothetical protein